jgi:hypothetical protein
MTIDLDRFARAQEVIVPIVDNWGKFQGRRIEIRTEDGWYKLELGNKAKIIKKASALEVEKTLRPLKKLMVYALAGEGVPINFDNFKKRGYSEAEPINFINAQPFDVVEVVEWEDDRLYYYGVNQRHQREVVRGVKESYQDKRSLPILSGLTPEIRYAFLLGNLQKESFAIVEAMGLDFANVSSEQRDRVSEALKHSFAHVLESSITKAGGKYIGHSQLNKDTYLVEWEVDGDVIKSHIHTDLRIVSAGFCLSGYDRLHTMNSIVNLAKHYQEEEYLNITRE